MDNLLCIDSEIAELYYREKVKARGIIRKNVQYDMQILTDLQTYIDRPTKQKNTINNYMYTKIKYELQ